MENSYNLRNPAVKRLMREAEELMNATDEYYAQPLEDNLFEWHFTVRGPPGTDFDSGIYHGRITLPADYPMKPPSIILLTPNGRFEINTKICLSISGHHPESWQPSWSIRTALLAIIGFMPTAANGALGSLDYNSAERKSLAKRSQMWKCSECGLVRNLLHISATNIPESTKTEEPNVLNQVKDEESDNLNRKAMTDGCLKNGNICEVDYNSQTDLINSTGHEQYDVAAENMPRRRLVEQSEASISALTQNTINNEPTLMHRSSNTFTTICIWFIAFVIIILLVRRLFFNIIYEER